MIIRLTRKRTKKDIEYCPVLNAIDDAGITWVGGEE
jgi:hypothetical protein